MFENISNQVGNYLPGILTAIVVLVVGWILAKIISMLVRKGLKKSGMGQRLSGAIAPDGNIDAGKFIAKLVFYLIMLFVLVTFFNVLNLPVVSAPLNAFLEKVFAFAPRILGAGFLAVIAYVVARVVREVSRRGLEAIDIDGKVAAIGRDASSAISAANAIVDTQDKSSLQSASLTGDIEDDFEKELASLDDDELADDVPPTASDVSPTAANVPSTAADDSESVRLGDSISEALYWLVFALFLPAILGALQMPGLLEPVQSMFTKALDYLPNIFGAAIILVIGLFVAKLVRQVVSNLSSSLGINKIAAKAGLGEAFSQRKLSDILGVVTYALVLLPVLVASLNTLDIEAVTKPAGAVLERISSLLPGFLGAAIVLGIAYFVGKIIASLTVDLLSGVGFDQMPERIGLRLSKLPGTQTPSQLAGHAVLVTVLLLSVQQALPMMGLDTFAAHVNTFAALLVRLIMALVIFGGGMYLANQAAQMILKSGVEGGATLANLARISVIVFAGGFALQHIGMSPSIINVAFGTLLGGVGLAIAIAFGWGGRGAAERLIDRYVK